MRGQTPHGGCFGGAGRHIWGCRTWPLWDPAQAPGVGGTRLQALNWERVLAWYWVLLASSWGYWPRPGVHGPAFWGPRPPAGRCCWRAEGDVGRGLPAGPAGTFIHPVPSAASPGGPGVPVHSWRCGRGRGAVPGVPPPLSSSAGPSAAPPHLIAVNEALGGWGRAAPLRPPRTCNTEVGCI